MEIEDQPAVQLVPVHSETNVIAGRLVVTNPVNFLRPFLDNFLFADKPGVK
jgi:hypothetical protein